MQWEFLMKYIALFFLACAMSQLAPALAASQETPVAAEVSPPGDIPDNQAFVTFKSAFGFSIKIPEGWARTDQTSETIFSDKYNHITLTTTTSTAAVDVDMAKATLAPEIAKTGHAVKIGKISEVKLKAGKAVKIAFDSNSEPNPVTNKQVREENEIFFFSKNGKRVTLRLSAPKGADNVDQWKLISSSFRWN
jgi:hypothetical protein